MGRPGWITEERVDQIDSAFDLIPTKRKRSNRDYRYPPTLISDFERLLEHDVPNTNYTFQLIHDWYAAMEPGYEKILIRAQMTPIDWKSKIGNSDLSTNFKTSYKEKIMKGDIVIRQDGMVYMLNWNVTNHPNNQASQNIECNDYLTFTREHHDAVDAYGFRVDVDDDIQLDENGREIIVKDMVVSHSEYNGRPDYSISQSQPGVVANNLVNMYMQYNSKTKNIHINDQTVIDGFVYTVHNIYMGETDIEKKHGCIYLQLRKLPGGDENA